MSSIDFHSLKRRWRVRWFQLDGQRAQRTFRTESEAQEFAKSIQDERPARRPGPTPVTVTSKQMRERITAGSSPNRAGCWIWHKRVGTHGYGVMTIRRDGQSRNALAHRISYEAHVAPIPTDLQIDHLCAVTTCVNPAHLEPVTGAENTRRRDARKAVSA